VGVPPAGERQQLLTLTPSPVCAPLFAREKKKKKKQKKEVRLVKNARGIPYISYQLKRQVTGPGSG
jgi:hypothetical protein